MSKLKEDKKQKQGKPYMVTAPVYMFPDFAVKAITIKNV